MHVAQWPLFQRVPQGYIVGPALFTIYVNGCGQNLNASVNFYTDDTIIYCAHISDIVFEQLQLAFEFIQSQLCQLRLLLNAGKKTSLCENY